MIGLIQQPPAREREADVFGFGATDMQAQGLRNMMVMATLPWAAFWTLGTEIAAQTLRRPGP